MFKKSKWNQAWVATGAVTVWDVGYCCGWIGVGEGNVYTAHEDSQIEGKNGWFYWFCGGEVEEATAVSKNVENNVERDGISSFWKKYFGALMVKINKFDSSNVSKV